MSTAKNKKQRLKLWNKSKRCGRCGVETVLPVAGERIKDNTATIQHKYGKFHPLRGKVDNTHSLWCNKCNLQDGHEWGLVIDNYGLNKKIEL